MEKFKVGVSVTGLKKRDRKSKHHFFNMGYITYNPNMTEEEKQEIISRAKSMVETNMKTHTGFSVSLDHVTIENDMETWMPFSDKNLKIKGV
jgi:hypothetical protein